MNCVTGWSDNISMEQADSIKASFADLNNGCLDDYNRTQAALSETPVIIIRDMQQSQQHDVTALP